MKASVFLLGIVLALTFTTSAYAAQTISVDSADDGWYMTDDFNGAGPPPEGFQQEIVPDWAYDTARLEPTSALAEQLMGFNRPLPVNAAAGDPLINATFCLDYSTTGAADMFMYLGNANATTSLLNGSTFKASPNVASIGYDFRGGNVVWSTTTNMAIKSSGHSTGVGTYCVGVNQTSYFINKVGVGLIEQDLHGIDFTGEGAYAYIGARNDVASNSVDNFLFNSTGNAAPLPSFSAVFNNATDLTKTGDTISFNSTASQSGSSISFWWFETNDSGAFINSSFVRSVVTPQPTNISFVITADTGTNVCGIFHANNTANVEATSATSCFDVKDGLFAFNFSIINRTRNEVVTHFNISLNDTNNGFFVSASTTTGLVQMRLNITNYTMRVNTTGLGFVIAPQEIKGETNQTLTIPFLKIVDRPTTELETTLVKFSILINETNDAQYSNVALVYNGTSQGSIRTVTNGEVWYNTTVSIGTFSAAQTNIEFFWNFTINPNVQTESYNLSIQDLVLINCAADDANMTVNFSVFNENNVSIPEIHRFEAQFEVFKNNISDAFNQSFDLNGQSTYYICLHPATTARTYTDIKYTVETGFTHRWFLINETLDNNTPQTINAFNFNDTVGISDLKGTVRNEITFDQITNIVGVLERQYLGEGVWRDVQMDRTGDFGLLFFNIVEESVNYRLRFLDGETRVVLKQANSQKFVCTAGVCDFTYLVTPTGASALIPDVGVATSYDNVTQVLTVAWNDPTSSVSDVTIKVTREDFSGTTTICEQTFATTTGTATCNVTGHSGPYLLRVRSSSSPSVFSFTQEFGESISSFVQLVGGQALASFVSGLIVISLGVAGSLAGIPIGIALVITGIFVSSLLGLVSFFSGSVVLTLAIVSIVIAHKAWGSRKQ